MRLFGQLRAIFGKQFLQFAFFGGLAMFIDMGALWIALHMLHLGVYGGRVFSFLCAATSTWLLNRTFTFKGIRAHNIVVEYFRFLGVAVVGGVINLAVYSLTIYFAPRAVSLPPNLAAWLPYLGVALGSACGLVFNYAGSRLAVFRATPMAQGAGSKRVV
jgi:putative flippase GtrA